ncbi:MAG: 30S ribosomal protein S20 [Armatimonadota bacterium]
MLCGANGFEGRWLTDVPNIKSSIKDVRKSRERRLRNQAGKSRMKTFIKKALVAIQTDPNSAPAAVAQALRIIDKTASKGIIHKNAAARRKSRLMKRLNAVLNAAGPSA